MKLLTANDFYPTLKSLIPNIPDHCRDILIGIETGSLVEIRCTFYTFADNKAVDLIEKTYNLVENNLIEKKTTEIWAPISYDEFVSSIYQRLNETRMMVSKIKS